MEKDLLIKLQHFFEVDLKLKKDMISIAPSKEFQYSAESAISKYTDSINDFLEYTFKYMIFLILIVISNL